MSKFTQLLKDLASVPGPSLNEEPRRGVLEVFFRNNGMVLETDAAGNGMVRIGQGDFKETVVYDAHMDVVQEGFAKCVTTGDGMIKGLGVADNLTAVTLLCLFSVVLKKMETGLSRPVCLLFSIGEEGLGNLKGIHQFVGDHVKPPHAFVSFDLSFEEYTVSALGSVRYKIKAECPGGHSWDDYGTPSAIECLFEFFHEIKKTFILVSSGQSGNLSFNIGTFAGGEGVNSIAGNAEAIFEFRGTDNGHLNELDRQVKSIVTTMNQKKNLSMTCIEIGRRPAAKAVCPERIEPIAVHVLKSIGEHSMPVVRSTNINATLAAGWPSLCMGLCKSGRFHSHDEFVILDSVEKGWQVLVELTRELAMVRR